jgi:hypothetical protein
VEQFQWNAPSNLAPSGAGLLILKLFWRQKARVVLGVKISGMIIGFSNKFGFILETSVILYEHELASVSWQVWARFSVA